MKRPLRFVFDYLVLSFLVSLAIILILIFNGNKLFQFAIIVGLSLIYLFWGIIHHKKEGNLHPKITLEYVLYAILGTVLVLGLL